MATQVRAHEWVLAGSVLLHRLTVVSMLAVLAGCGLPGGALPTGILPTAVEGETEAWPEAHLYPENAPACAQLAEPRSDIHKAMFDELNQYRVDNGLQPLLYSQTLETAADNHVADLWERGFFSHINPEGLDPGDRAVRAGFCHSYVGENIAAGQTSTAHVLQAWIDSPPHKVNLLDPNYVYVGMGYSVDRYGRQYWGQAFAYDLP